VPLGSKRGDDRGRGGSAELGGRPSRGK